MRRHKWMIAMFLLIATIVIGAVAYNGMPPTMSIFTAIEEGKTEQVERAIRWGFVNTRGRGAISTTPLHEAAIFAPKYHGNDIIKLLIANGAEVDARDRMTRTPLHLAIEWECLTNYGYFDVAEALLAAGANINESSAFGTPLDMAARKGRTDIVKWLLAHGADINAKEVLGRTPLDVEIEMGNEDMAAFLRGLGAKESKRTVIQEEPEFP